MWPTVTGVFTSSTGSTSTVAMAPPFSRIAIASSSRQTPGSRTERLDRKARVQSLSLIPSTIVRRQSSPVLIAEVSIQVANPAASRSARMRSTSFTLPSSCA